MLIREFASVTEANETLLELVREIKEKVKKYKCDYYLSMGKKQKKIYI